ncbi:MAG: HAD family hydrolase [Terracidiphilus sp.]
MPTEISGWSFPEFEQKVFDSNPKVAVFDCDGTLWSGDTGFGFMCWSLDQGVVSRSTSDWIDTRYRAYQAGSVGEWDMCAEMVQIYAGLSERELRIAAARYVSEAVPSWIFPEMAMLVDRLRRAGIEIWAVSSTNKWVVTEGVRAFGIDEDHVLAAEVSVRDGLICSEILHVPTDEGKAAALARVGLARPDAVFGNSIHDLAMLKAARFPFPVNPSEELLAAAVDNGWGYFQPRPANSAAGR